MKRVFVFLIFIIIISNCGIIPFPAQSSFGVFYYPNPAEDPVYTSAYGWTWTVKVSLYEDAGVPMTLGNYGPNGEACISVFLLDNYQVVDTFRFYRDDIESWFGSLRLPAYVDLYHNASFATYSYNQGIYIETYYGIDDNGNYVSATDTLILINNTKGKKHI